MAALQPIWDWIVLNQAVLIPVVVMIIDWWVGKNPNSPANNVLHWIELKLKSMLATPPKAP